MLKLIRINFFVLFGILVFLEIAGQLVSFIKNKQFLFDDHKIRARHQLFRPHPYLSVALNKNLSLTFKAGGVYPTVKTTELGTRWTGADLKDTSKIRIACIGGSTTFCTGVKDEDSWPAVLQRNLGDKYAIINFGVPAYKSVEGIIQLALYVPEVKPDFVIMYMGGNDLYQYHSEENYPDYYHSGEVLMPRALLCTDKYESGFDKFVRQSGFFYIVHNVEELIYPVKMPPRFTGPDDKVDKMYVRNLNSMLALASNMNSQKILIGQVFNPFTKWIENPWSSRLKSDLIIPMMSRMNEKARITCESDSTCNYLDFANSLPLKPDHFLDEMHFTIEGNLMFAEAVETAIRKSESSVAERDEYALNIPKVNQMNAGGN